MSKETVRMLKEEKYMRLQFERWRRDPLAWLEERLGEDRTSFCWSEIEGYEGHEWDGDVDPLASAWRVIASSYLQVLQGKVPKYRFTALESATGTSKTYWLARLVFWFLDCFENSLVVTTAPKKDQLQLGLWSEIGMISNKIKKIHPKAQFYKLRVALDESTVEELDDDKMNTSNSWHAVGFIAGAGSEEQSAGKARGFHRSNMLIILEECTGIRPAVINAFQNTSTGMKNYIVALGNPDNEFDPLHRFAIQEDVVNFRISAFDYPNIVLQKELFEGAVTQASINSRTTTYGKDSPLWNAMVRGLSPQQSVDSLIQVKWVEQCIDLKKTDRSSYNAVGADVANSLAGDKASLAWGVGPVLVKVEEFQCANATHLAYNLFMNDVDLSLKGYHNYNIDKLEDYNTDPNCIGVDAVGVGVATVNALVDSGYQPQPLQGGPWKEVIPMEEVHIQGKVVEKPMYEFSTLRSQMMWELREDLRLKNIGIVMDDKEMVAQLKKELCIAKYKTNAKTIIVEPKDKIKKRLGGKSPNVADAIAYWNWVRKGYRIKAWGLGAVSAGN